jgi:lipopolysaccharide transport system ATP-binding protein
MYSDIVVNLDNVGKCYQIYEAPKDRLMQIFFQGRKRFYHEFWAVKNLSLKIKKGETVGIIGRNGSGKSTLLQIICGTLTPTLGEVQTKGRIAALLELGSGFNPDFTGRENIFINAALLGLTREEIIERFDDIVAFADVGEFIDQPVKLYSTGMYVRLAFSVMAHVNADILVIDEALAVGDAVFTQKCMRYLRRFKERGTLIFVSHDMNSVLNLCDTAIWLSEGRLVANGKARDIAEQYLKYTLQEVYGQDIVLSETKSNSSRHQSAPHEGTDNIEPSSNAGQNNRNTEIHFTENLKKARGWQTGSGEIVEVRIERIGSGTKSVLEGGERVKLVIKAVIHKSMENPILGFLVRDRLGQDLFGENTLPFTDLYPRYIGSGKTIEGEFTFQIPMLPNGEYALMASLAEGNLHSNIQHHWLHDAMIIKVASSKIRWGLVGIQFQNVTLNILE